MPPAEARLSCLSKERDGDVNGRMPHCYPLLAARLVVFEAFQQIGPWGGKQLKLARCLVDRSPRID